MSEWAVHPGLDTPELRAIDPSGTRVRQTDLDFLMSQKAKDVVKEEGIVLLDYRALAADMSRSLTGNFHENSGCARYVIVFCFAVL